jgi:hypothetical protein
MPLRRTAGAALAAAGLLAVPAAASAASSVVAGPIKVKDYQMTLVAGDNGKKDTLSAILTREAGKSTQMHLYSFANGVSVKVAGSNAKISAGLGRYGTVKLAMKGGSVTKGTVPQGCSGSPGRTLKGTLKGKLRLVADRTYFKTIKAGSLRGLVSAGGSLKCQPTTGGGGGGGQTGGLTLSAMRQAGGGMTMLNVVKGPGGGVLQQVTRMDPSAQAAPASVMHMINAQTRSGAFTAAANLGSASVTGAGPFFTGKLGFSGDGMGTMATGTLSGNLTARFDSIGAVSFGSGDATLMKR